MYKHYNHEGGNCSPFLAHWPDGIKQPGRWVRHPIHLFDIMPTLCELAGAAYPETHGGECIHPHEGMSLAPIFRAESLPDRSLCFDHFEASAIRKGKWKLLRGNARYPHRNWELYDMEQDRCETTNLAQQHPDVVRSLAEEWQAWAVRVKVYPYFLDEI